jgi:hypothetical protein
VPVLPVVWKLSELWRSNAITVHAGEVHMDNALNLNSLQLIGL